MRRWGRIALWVLALLPTVSIAVLSVWLLAESLLRDRVPDRRDAIDLSGDVAGTMISAGTLLVSTVGTISIWLGWRKERRGSREYTLKIQQLEMQVAELRTKNSSTTPPVAP